MKEQNLIEVPESLQLNAEIEKEQKPLEQADFNLLESFKFANREYRLINFDNELTYIQFKIAKPIIANILKPVYNNLNIDYSRAKYNEKNEVINASEIVDYSNIDMSMLLAGVSAEDELKLIALCYLESNETKFNIQKYNDRIDLFNNLDINIYSQLMECLPFLFAGLMPLIQKGFRMSSNLLTALK
jgi:hypothetical protein